MPSCKISLLTNQEQLDKLTAAHRITNTIEEKDKHNKTSQVDKLSGSEMTIEI